MTKILLFFNRKYKTALKIQICLVSHSVSEFPFGMRFTGKYNVDRYGRVLGGRKEMLKILLTAPMLP